MPVASPLTPWNSTEEGTNACLCLHPVMERARHGPGSATRVPHPRVLESRVLSVCPSGPQPSPLAHCVLEPDLCMDVPGFLLGPVLPKAAVVTSPDAVAPALQQLSGGPL